MSSWRRLGWVGLVAAAVTLTVASVAGAHSALLSSDPADGARLDVAPDAVVLEFSEPPDPDLSTVDVLDSAGERVDVGDITPSADDASVVRLDLPPLDDGVFTVNWSALSTVDGHATTGAYSFIVGSVGPDEAASVPVETEEQRGQGPIGVAGRWLVYVGLAGILGWATSILVVFRERPAGRPWIVVGCWLLASVGLGLIIQSKASSVDTSIRQLLTSEAGDPLVRTGLSLAALGIGMAVAVFGRGRGPVGVVAALTALTMFAHVEAGHAGAPDPDEWLNLSSQWIHLVAIGTWVGGLGWLLARTRRHRAEEQSPELVGAIGRFSVLASVCIIVVVITGVVRAVDEVGSFDALWSTDYGRTLLVKLGMVTMLAALGALNRFWNVPAILRGAGRVRRLRRTVRSEVVFAAVVLGIGGVLSGLPPPSQLSATDGGAASRQADEAIEVTGSDFATTMRVTMQVEPGTVGQNRFVVRIADYDTGETVNAVRVALRFTVPTKPDLAPSMLELTPAGDDRWEAESTALSQPARWQATVVIGLAADGVEIPLEFDVRAGDGLRAPGQAGD